MEILVQKFGGTSLQTEESRNLVCCHIEEALDHHKKIIVVVSAMGRSPSPYATDTLLSLVNFPEQFVEKRELDLLMACGEIISSVILSNELCRKNISSCAITGAQAGIVTNDDYTNATIQYVNPSYVLDLLTNYDVIVVAGFQGKTLSGEMTTIGRGGSDITAAALGAALHAEVIEIFTDVTGVMTADPKIVPHAKPIEIATYIEICNLAYQGAKVIHPRAIEIAMKADIPLKIKSTYTKNKGTLITSLNRKRKYQINEQTITGIAYRRNLTHVSVQLKENQSLLQKKVFKKLSKKGISVDFVHISPTKLTFTIPDNLAYQAEEILSTLKVDRKLHSNCAKVSVVGVNMTGIPGIVSTIVDSLINDGISILQSADNYSSIWVLIEDDYLDRAVNNLHRAFHLNDQFIKKR